MATNLKDELSLFTESIFVWKTFSIVNFGCQNITYK